MARSRRGTIGESWWSHRFIELLESFGVGSRLTRGRHYARAGQVVELDVEGGVAIAKVQGSRYTPYKVRIRTKLLSDAQWRRVERAMATQALVLAKLLAGEMPHDIDDVFAVCKLTLFPRTASDLKASCTCPDWENPCKHVAAVYYILAEQFDEDPFLIFAWRGRSKDELLDALHTRRSASGVRQSRSGAAPPPSGADDVRLPLPADVATFWSSGPVVTDLSISPHASETPDLLLRELGPGPVSNAGPNVVTVLTPCYATIAKGAERRSLR
ncbi:MAG: SWIM zinc finger family protein [Solirubrobacteraceae bacterium]